MNRNGHVLPQRMQVSLRITLRVRKDVREAWSFGAADKKKRPAAPGMDGVHQAGSLIFFVSKNKNGRQEGCRPIANNSVGEISSFRSSRR